MKKLLLSAALVAGVTGAALAPRAASANDGTVSINGSISTETCKINGGSSPANLSVTLPTVSISSLKAAGAFAGATPFNIVITACNVNGVFASTFFEPGPTVMADGNLKNSGLAQNVEVQLLNANGQIVNLAAASGSQQTTTGLFNTNSDGTGTTGLTGAPLQFFARYFATAAAVAGTVKTTVDFTMIYQ